MARPPDHLIQLLEQSNQKSTEYMNKVFALQDETRKLKAENKEHIESYQVLRDETRELEQNLKKCRKRNYKRPTVSWINGSVVSKPVNDCVDEKKEIEELKLLEKVTNEQFQQEVKIIKQEKDEMQIAFDLAVKKASEETEKAEKELQEVNVELERLRLNEKIRIEKEEKEEEILRNRLMKTKSPSEIAAIHKEMRIRANPGRTPTLVPKSNQMGYDCVYPSRLDSSSKDIERSCQKVLGGAYKTIGECRLDCVKPGHVRKENSQ